MLPPRLSDRLHIIQWLLPVMIMLVALLYQLGPARYFHDHYGAWSHYALELFLYGIIGPAAVWQTLRTVHGWVQEKEEAEAEVYRLNTQLHQRVDERTQELRQKNLALADANRQLQELDRLKSEFVSLVSHELRAPLTNVRGAIELMESGCPNLNSTCTRMVPIMDEQIRRLGRLVEEVLNISQIESGELKLKRQLVEAVEIADQVIEEFQANAGGLTIRDRRTIRRLLSKGYPRLYADSDRLHQVITNLIDNAVKYSPSGSDVTLEIEANARECIFSVSDHGPGIPPDQQAHLFEKFYRLDSSDTKETYGHGLGLYLSRRLVEAMGGRIWVESATGRGSTFRFALPVMDL